jgi:DNA-binding CsgD family transcriptional regulator
MAVYPGTKLLLVGSEDVLKTEVTHRIFNGLRFRLTGRSTSLLNALACLEPRTIDLVLLSCEYREEEVSLFALAAQRRGFSGLIMRCVSEPKGVMLDVETDDELHGQSQRPISFTEKQKAVVTRVYEGMTNQQIARDLNCSEGSVKAVIQELFKKLGVKKRTQIVRMACEKPLTERLNSLL